MANIPGILGFVAPGSYSLVELRPGPVSLPGGPTVTAILGRGRREEFVVSRAVGGGADGAPKGFNPANQPDGRHFMVSTFPVVPGSIEIFINPKNDGTDLPLIQITSEAMAQAWAAEFGDIDGYYIDGTNSFPGFNGPFDDSVDAYQGASDGSGFFDSKWARQFAILKARLGITAGSVEPNHYLFDAFTGRVVLDQTLQSFDTLLVSYLAEADLNSPEMMFDLTSVIAKHGYPSRENSISLAAQMAFENGAGVVMPVHIGEVLQGLGSARRLVQEPTLFTGLKALEKEDALDILVPVMSSRINNEIIMPFYEAALHASLTSNGQFLQEDPATGDQPGINISPLATIPSGHPGAGNPVYLEVYKNGRLLQLGVDYSVPNLSGTSLNGTINALIALDPNYPGAQHTVNNTLQEGDRITANYLPSTAVIDLVATSQLAVVSHCQIMSETKNRRERVALLGSYEFVDLDFILDPVTGIEAVFGVTKRSQFFWPGGPFVNRVVGGENQILDGQYIAASAAGFYSSRPLTTSLTNKILTGFTINPAQKLSIDETNFAGGAGVSIIEPLSAGGKVLIGQTTTNSGRAVEEEMSVVRITDYVAKVSRQALQGAFTGSLITVNTPRDIKITTEKILSSLQSQGIITQFKGVNAVIDPNEPRQVNVTFDITPIFPLNWIFIRFSVGT